MTLTSPPYVLQGSSHGAQLFREAISSLLAPAGGIVQASDFALTQNGSPNMSVNVGAGRIWIPGTSLATVNPGGGAYYPQGAYYAESDAAVNLAISASDPSNPRIDTVICQVQDAAYVGVTNSAALAVVTGTPTSGATLVNLNGKGAVPASSMVIGYVLVPANASTVVTADLSTTVSTALPGLSGGIFLSGLDAAKPAATTVKGAEYYATDSNALYYSDGTAWRTIYGSRGAVNIAAAESRPSSPTVYGPLTTSDQVTNIVLPANGLIAVWYQATWQSSASAAGRAAIFVNGNQLHYPSAGGGPLAFQEASSFGTASSETLATYGLGLAGGTVGNYGGDAAFGQGVGAGDGAVGSGGPCYLFGLAAATYTIAVQFKSASGSVTVSNRKLWAQAMSFG